MVQYEVTVKLVPSIQELFGTDSKKIVLEFPWDASPGQIKEALNETIPESCVVSYVYEKRVVMTPGSIVRVVFSCEYGNVNLVNEVTEIDEKKNTFTVPLTESHIKVLRSTMDYKTFSSYKDKDHIVFNMSDCTEVSRKKHHKATVVSADEFDSERYTEALKRKEITSKINAIVKDCFADGYDCSQCYHTTEELESFLSALQTFVKKS